MDNDDPLVDIVKPLRGLYLFNSRPFPLLRDRIVIIGPIEVELAFSDNQEVAKAEYYLDGELEYTIVEAPFKWYMKERLTGFHDVKVVVYDGAGNTAEDTVDFLRYL